MSVTGIKPLILPRESLNISRRFAIINWFCIFSEEISHFIAFRFDMTIFLSFFVNRFPKHILQLSYPLLGHGRNKDRWNIR